MPPTDVDATASVIAAARSFRDAWIPIEGPRPSGFTVPATLNFDELLEAALAHGAAISETAALSALLDDPSISVVDVADDTYPRRLASLDGRPAVLFLHGSLPAESCRSAAIVGSRRASPAGRAAARSLGEQLSSAGVTVVSGLAEGIDAAAHEGALAGGSPTIAVMGTGLGVVFPKAHGPLARRIARQGVLVTQFPPGFGPTKSSFPARNAVIAGLGDVSILVEMSERSGTRIEAECALAQGKQVLLWEPILGGQGWAQEFAEQPAVRFTDSADDVVAALEQVDEQAGSG